MRNYVQTDNCTGAGPTRLSLDGKTLGLFYPFGRQWADLYTTWNLAFVTNFRNWPYMMVKLLIPRYVMHIVSTRCSSSISRKNTESEV